MERNWVILLLIFVVLFAGFSSASATPAKIVCGVVSNVVSALVKSLWSLKSTPRTEFSSRSMMKFEGGYTVETVFDGSKLGIDPYSVDVSPSGELLVLDSENSNIYKISTPLSQYSRPKLIAGSPEGYPGHVDGKLREARMNHPKGITVDDRGNIYVADTLNMAIRKITDAGMVTIAGGKGGRGGGHVDGPSEDAKFSDDFDVVYIGSSCSLLVVDRGNQAIREIQLQEDDCTYQYDGNLRMGIAVLVAAAFFGYMLALLQRKVGSMFSSHKDPEASMRKDVPRAPYQRPIKYVRAPLIPTEDESEKPEEGLFGRKKPRHNHIQQHYQQPIRDSNAWPMQESFVIPDEDEPPSIETRTSAPRKTYPFTTKDAEKTRHFKQSHSFHASMETRTSEPRKTYPFTTKDAEKTHHFNQSRSFHSGWNDNLHHQHQQQQQQHQRHYSSGPQTYYENRCETNEIVFGAVQEQDGRRGAVVIKAVDYGDPMYNNHNIRSRYNYMGYYYGC